ncbi:VOC family protein [Halobacillus sp. Nhm2S1]|uniref:VOC family protein n=1 Tax=Halobacillus sp. Nhm2S1 TaxID=2866716 RepID=UPI001C737F5F|nr:VOC family protein [Halobacillus sp. Nhm2S1]MBX0356964.1 VOC family protein [Halobacillus sp. Nhm2S1]
MFQVGSVFVPVTNLEKSKKWYEEHLGVKEIDSWGGGAGFFFPQGSVQFGLIEVSRSQSTEFEINKGEKNSFFNFVVDDIHAAFRQLKDAGVETTEIQDFGGMKHFDFFDPDQNVFSVVDEDLNSPFHKENVRTQQEKMRTTQ